MVGEPVKIDPASKLADLLTSRRDFYGNWISYGDLETGRFHPETDDQLGKVEWKVKGGREYAMDVPGAVTLDDVVELLTGEVD